MATLVLAAIVIEGAALCLWPTVYFLDARGHFGEMFLARYAPVEPILQLLKNVVDWIVPGALWKWEHIIAFFFQCVIAAFTAYAVAAWRLTAPRSSATNELEALRSDAVPWILVAQVVFQATLVLVPATMTTDIYNYALYGEMPVRYGANPFIQTPSEFPQSPLYYLIPLYWHDAPSVYGPFWVALSAGVAAILRDLPLADELLCYRLIANASHLANTGLVWAIARRLRPERATSAALVYGWNPLLLVDFALNGHNDVLMLTFVLAAFLTATYGRARSVAVLLGMSIATKFTSVLVAPIALAYCARAAALRWAAGASSPPPLMSSAEVGEADRGAWRSRAVLFSVTGAIAAATLVLLYLPWVRGLETFGPVLYWASGPRLNNFAPEQALISVASWTAGWFGSYETAWDAILAAFKLLAKGVLVAWIVVEAVHARSMEDVLAASARVSLVFLLLVNTWVMPWYYAWPLAFCAALGWPSLLVRVCAGFTLTALVVMYQRQFGHAVVDEWAGLFLVLPLVLALAPTLVRHFAPGKVRSTLEGGLARRRARVARAG